MIEKRESFLKEKSIMIVEDEPDILNLIEEALSLSGAKVYTAASSEQALRIYENENIDLIISDIRMPGQGGTYLLSQVRKRDSTVPPIILITGYADVSPEDAYSMGADGFLFKPFGVQSILEASALALAPIEKKWIERKEAIASELEIVRSFDSKEQMIESDRIQFGRGGFFIRLDGELPAVNEIAECRIEFSDNRDLPFQFHAICRWVRPEALKNSQGPFRPRGAGFEFVQISQSSRPIWNQIWTRAGGASYIPNSVTSSEDFLNLR